MNRKLDRRDFLRLGLAAGGGLALYPFVSGCASPSAPPSPPASSAAASPAGSGAPSPAAKPPRSFTAKVAAAHINTPGYSLAPVIVGYKKGFFEEEGIKEEFVDFAGGGEVVRGILVGGCHFGFTSPSAPVVAFNQGEPMRIIASLTTLPVIGYFTKADSPLKSIQDVAGHSLGVSRPNSNSHFLAVKSIRGAGLDPASVKLIFTGGVPETWTAVKTGQVDVGWAGEDYFTLLGIDSETKLLFHSRDYVKAHGDYALTTTEKFVKENLDILQQWVRAHDRSIAYVKDPKNADDVVKIIAEFTEIKPEASRKVYNTVNRDLWSTKIVPAVLKTAEEAMLQSKEIDKPVDWAKLVDQSPLPEASRADLKGM